MALINCPECGKEISDQSACCINCGFPIQKKIINKNRVFPINTVIGYTCDKCNIPDAVFKVISSNIDKTKATCEKCGNNVEINFNNIVLTDDEYDSIYDDIYDNDVDTAVNKIVAMLNCDVKSAEEYVNICRKQIEKMEKACNLVHTENRREKLEEYETQKHIQEYQYINNAECPYCHSKDTNKISGLSKAGSVALWGIFAVGKVNKQWHCNNCKSNF